MELTANNQKPWNNSSLSFPIMWNDEMEDSSDQEGKNDLEGSMFLASRLLLNKLKQKQSEDNFVQLKNELERIEKEFSNYKKKVELLENENNELKKIVKKISKDFRM